METTEEYVTFTKVYNEQCKLHGRTEKAVIETIRICKDKNVLREYLESREKEVIDMMVTLFDEEKIMKAHDKTIQDQGIMSTIKLCKKMDWSYWQTIQQVMEDYGFDEETAEKRVKEFW